MPGDQTSLSCPWNLRMIRPVETSQYRSCRSPPHELSFELSLPIQQHKQLQHNLHTISIPRTPANTSTRNQAETIRLPPGDGHIANLPRMTIVRLDMNPFRRIPQAQAPVLPAAEAVLPVLVVAHREHRPLVPLEHRRLLARQPRPRTRTRTRHLRVAIRVPTNPSIPHTSIPGTLLLHGLVVN